MQGTEGLQRARWCSNYCLVRTLSGFIVISCIVGGQCYGDLVANVNLGTLAQEAPLVEGMPRSEIVNLAGNTGRGGDNAQLYNGVFGNGAFVCNE